MVGTDDKEYDENLERVMRKLEESGITLNYEKCEIGVSSISYTGDEFSGEGPKLSDERVKEIIEPPVPQNQPKLKSFLGSIQFFAKFIADFSTVSSPLWVFTCTDAKWKWGPQEDKAFQDIKVWLTQAPVMAYHKVPQSVSQLTLHPS